ncbi:hypothetical protein FB561_5979 [Kribbella amoyensis]|uniref:Uncharacterized protein n=1 Tax=Kribbella amoyensis TaxID=996641 RepID=A0A561C0T6_9ACTN|nr:hypothetical protein [Kribbella amoyensis]TWD84783.1 hypothetical protein FB561_5979 [Kribbella amoyensis]
MTFTRLPKDWRRQPLSDPVLAADVIDLYCTVGDRRRGSLMVVICDEEERFRGAIAVDLSELSPDLDPRGMTEALKPVVDPLSVYPEGALILALARVGPMGITASDAAWLEASVQVCRVLGIRLLGFYVASRSTVERVDLPAAEAPAAA